MIANLGFSPRVLREMWRSPRGRELARRIAFRDLTFPDYVQAPVFLWAAETMHADALPEQLSADQQALLDELIRELWSAAAHQRISSVQAIGLFQAWQGDLSWFGWSGATARLDPALRGPLAYIGGHRMRRLSKPKADVIRLFRTAWNDAAPGSRLRRLAQAELESLHAR
jgi:hypothetical protein